MARLHFAAVQLPASSGEFENGARRVEAAAGERGNLTYGPYAPLSAGAYTFEIAYRASGRGGHPGAWDVFAGGRDGGATFARGALEDTNGEVAVKTGGFEVPPSMDGRRVEIRTFFEGPGALDLHSIGIARADGASCAGVDAGDLRRLSPISVKFGFDRGQPVDRFYIAEFLAKHAADIRGRVLEVGDREYTLRFGGRRVSQSDVLMPVEHPAATVVSDLTHGSGIPDGAFDCIVLTQVLVCVYDVRSAAATLHRILKPGGVALITLPAITKTEQDYDWPFLWSFTGASARRLFGEPFGPEQVEVDLHGNVFAATAFLYGLSFHELSEPELRHLDPNFQVTVGVRAVKKT